MRPVIVAWVARALGPTFAAWVPGYVAMLIFGALVAAISMVDATSRAGYARRDALMVLAFAWMGGLVGAAAVPVLQGLAVWLRTGHFRFPTGLAAYGGLVGGMLATAATLRLAKLAVVPFLDAGTPSLGLAYFFTRIGCFLAGCDYGRVTSSPLAVRFPPGSPAFRDHVAQGLVAPDAVASLPVHPTELYLAFAGLFLYFVTDAIPMRGDGRRFAAYVLGYATLRFAIEMLRGDASRGAIGPLSTSQAIAVGTVIALIVLQRRGVILSRA